MKRVLLMTWCLSLVPFMPAAQRAEAPKKSSLVERVGDTGFIQLEAESFRQLEPRQQQLAYWLTQASIAIDPIVYDQLSAHGVREKRLLEEIVTHQAAVDPAVFKQIRDFALRFWANRGNHNEMTSRKFLPSFTLDELRAAALKAQAAGAFKAPYADLPALATPDALKNELADLNRSLFDDRFEPMITAKTPPPVAGSGFTSTRPAAISF